MKKSIVLSVLFFLFVLKLSAQTWQLAWSEEFEGNKLNTGLWNYETGNGEGGWGTNQMDYCTDRKENVDVKNGRLVITVHKEDSHGFQYTSGRINSRDRMAVKYGKIEARIKAPGGRGIGAAFWMLPQAEKYGWWPRSGEIDILETNGHEIHTNYGTIHYMQWDTHQYTGKPVTVEGDITKEFHLYSIIWDENSIKWLLDNKVYNEIFIKEPLDGRKPFNEDFFFIISAGVGSDFSGKKIEDKLLPQTFEVDYVRVYKQVFKPELLNAQTSTDGSEVELKFSQPVLPGIKAENILLSDQEHTLKIQSIGSKYRDNFSVILSLGEKITKDSEVKISFNEKSIQSVEKQYSEAVKDFTVVNVTKGADPMLAAAQTVKESDCIEMVFTKALDLRDAIVPEELTILVNGKKASIKQILPKPGYPTIAVLILNEPLFDTSTIMISYTGTGLKSPEGGVLKKFEQIKVRNELSEKYSIPGKIEAENYLNHKGIMSENCNDEGGGRNIGYIDTGDWMEYEIYIKESDTYKINFRIAAASISGAGEISLNGRIITTTEFPATYNWQSWKTVTSETVRLEKGVYRLLFQAKTGGFNLNWLDFFKVQE